MIEQDIATRRARDLERYHGRVAERRAMGLCLKCGKRPPAPHRSQCEPCIEKRRRADLARHHRRTAEHTARGLCPKCGKQPPASGRTLCEACNEKRNRASRARDARLRAAGIPRRDPERARAYERERSRREVEQRRAAELCLHCGKAPALGGRTTCEPCAEARAGARAHALREGEGRGQALRRAQGSRPAGVSGANAAAGATRLGALPVFAPDAAGIPRSKAARPARPAARRSGPPSGRSTPPGAPPDCVERAAAPPPTAARGSRCAPCAVAETARYPSKNAARREQYAKRRAERRCTDCGEPSQGAARCEPCARRSWERSAYFRTMPVFDPQFTVVDLDTGDEHGPFDSWEDVALAMAFARLAPERVEVLTDAPAIAGIAAWA